MPNTYFQFKEFIIHQDQCAMKVGTDGVILGAWTSFSEQYILDIGAGSGLLSLMMAQRFPEAKVSAVEINQEAFQQASENIKNSPFHQQIKIHHASFEDFTPPHSLDLIICNPPYFKGHVIAASENRTTARHQTQFSLSALFEYAHQNLAPAGKLSMVYPTEDLEGTIKKANSAGLFLTKHTAIKGHTTAQVKRCLLQFELIESELQTNTLIIEEKRHQYTDAFKALVKPFYLKVQ